MNMLQTDINSATIEAVHCYVEPLTFLPYHSLQISRPGWAGCSNQPDNHQTTLIFGKTNLTYRKLCLSGISWRKLSI